MAYDRYDRDERSRWSNDRNDDRSGRNWRGEDRSQNMQGGRDERGFWDRASDEVSSWFGDDDAERRRRQDHMRDEREGGYGRSSSEHRDQPRDYDRGYGRDYDRDRERSQQRGNDWGDKFRTSDRGGFSERDYNPSSRRDIWGARDWDDRDRDRDRNRSFGQDRERARDRYRPMTGDYGCEGHESDQFFAASGYGRGERDYDRSQTPYGRDETRRTSFAGSRERNPDDRDFDPHYRSWRDRHLGELDRDYDDFQREHQSRFENDFSSWREKRQQKRGLMGQIREHMEVVGDDQKHVGTVDRTAGDRIILTKSDPESGGVHHSLSCSDIDKVEGDKVILDCSADEAKSRWRDESRSRALFEREDQGEMGPRTLNRSFEGTYR